ncbi:hypothetical protein VNO80_29408 [Phaseolus coccineus]|uniref:Uncharacterized protein n=1 Tax=Phaseolus coccineus TaxID=3886 RepID=A0AAN9LEC2_PHACN
MLDVFPDYRKEAEDHLSKAGPNKKILCQLSMLKRKMSQDQNEPPKQLYASQISQIQEIRFFLNGLSLTVLCLHTFLDACSPGRHRLVLLEVFSITLLGLRVLHWHRVERIAWLVLAFSWAKGLDLVR